MNVAYAASYIDAVFQRRDSIALYDIIHVRARTSPLPDECLLFIRMLEWLGSDWQYYETVKEQDFAELSRLLEMFEMNDVLAMYREGKSASQDSEVLSRWFDQHEADARSELFRLAEQKIDFLKKNEG